MLPSVGILVQLMRFQCLMVSSYIRKQQSRISWTVI